MTTKAASRRYIPVLFALTFLVNATLVSTAKAQCIQSPSGLIHWWPGDRSPSDVVGGSHGTLQNGVAYSGQVGSAFVFDGIDDFVVSAQNSTLTGNPSFTIEGWIYVPSSAGLTGPSYPPIL